MQHTEIKELLQTHHIKYTKGVEEILTCFISNPAPLDVYSLHDNSDKNLATIYRIVNKLTNAGILSRVQFNEQKSFYELSKPLHHHHFICTNCGKIIDIDCSSQELEKEKKEIAKKYHLLINDQEINFTGLCNSCNYIGKQR